MGVNFVRLPHYPQSARMMRLADRMGILVWEEVPVYWAIEFDNPQVLAKAQQQLAEIIRRDRDKASVIFWSVANETPATSARNTFLASDDRIRPRAGQYTSGHRRTVVLARMEMKFK